MPDWICVKVFNTRLYAEVVKRLLEANGILSRISADDAGGSEPFPFQPSSTGVRLLVKKQDEAKARELLRN